jgi:hypothetical protein
MGVHFVDELVEIVFVTGTEVDEGLDCLVGVCRDILLLRFFYNLLIFISICSFCDSLMLNLPRSYHR